MCLNQSIAFCVLCHWLTPVVYRISRLISSSFILTTRPSSFLPGLISLHSGRLMKSFLWSFNVTKHSLLLYFYILFSSFSFTAISADFLSFSSTASCVDFLYSVTFLFSIEKKKSNSQSLLKVSKFRKQIILSSHCPKNQRNFSHFFALASKKSWKVVQTKDESTKRLIWCCEHKEILFCLN